MPVVQPRSAASESAADRHAVATAGQSPAAVADSRTHAIEGRRAPAFVGDLLESEAVHGTRIDMANSPELGRELGSATHGVRLHAGAAAGIAAKTLGARAFSWGRDVYLASDAPRPATRAGRALLAHELAHTVEDGAGDRIARTPGVAYASERQAAEAAFDHLLGTVSSANLSYEWGGYIYQNELSHRGQFSHSPPRTDKDSGSVDPLSAEFASKDAAKLTGDWTSPDQLDDPLATVTATYHTHPKDKNTSRGDKFSDISSGPSVDFPYEAKRSGDIPDAQRTGFNAYMIYLAEADAPPYTIHQYLPGQRPQDGKGLDQIRGLDQSTAGNEHICQMGFTPEGQGPDYCTKNYPNPQPNDLAKGVIQSGRMAQALAGGTVSEAGCEAMFSAAQLPESSMCASAAPAREDPIVGHYQQSLKLGPKDRATMVAQYQMAWLDAHGEPPDRYISGKLGSHAMVALADDHTNSGAKDALAAALQHVQADQNHPERKPKSLLLEVDDRFQPDLDRHVEQLRCQQASQSGQTPAECQGVAAPSRILTGTNANLNHHWYRDTTMDASLLGASALNTDVEAFDSNRNASGRDGSAAVRDPHMHREAMNAVAGGGPALIHVGAFHLADSEPQNMLGKRLRQSIGSRLFTIMTLDRGSTLVLSGAATLPPVDPWHPTADEFVAMLAASGRTQPIAFDLDESPIEHSPLKHFTQSIGANYDGVLIA